MKKITFLLVLLCLSQIVIAQKYIDEADSLFKFIDKNQIPRGILYDRIAPLSDLPAFDGIGKNDTTNHYHFIQTSFLFYSSKISLQQPR